MKFTVLLEKWMDAREEYKESPGSDDQTDRIEAHRQLLRYEDQINATVEELQVYVRSAGYLRLSQ